uniref:ATP-binding protein n=1 Tax=Anaerococcus mediterraneensis TaxID=1870984 RepID=UPI000930F098|nr:anti-sigma regulatory factor [Anaerococcus mediterraneensis]
MDKISIKIPSKSLYIKSLRLFAAGLGSDLDFDIEKIEDLKVLVSEAVNYKMTDDDLEINFFVGNRSLEIEVYGKDETGDDRAITMRNSIIKALADECEIEGDLLKISLRADYD